MIGGVSEPRSPDFGDSLSGGVGLGTWEVASLGRVRLALLSFGFDLGA